MREIKTDRDMELQVIATGMHLSRDFGNTYEEIEKDGFTISAKVDIELLSDETRHIASSTGKAIAGFAQVYDDLKPDIVVVLGDRFEIFGASAAACISRIPVAHINGGEITEGAFDEAFRHSITKMSQLHFTSAEEYRKRVIQLGEDPDTVINAGALGVDNINALVLMSREDLEESLDFKFHERNFLITFHPVTLEDDTSEEQFAFLLEALDRRPGAGMIFTKSNADSFGRIINKMIDDYVTANSDKAVAFVSMGQVRYLSAMKFVDAVVGNSSSGIIETPNFKIPTVNIGDRQKGRIRVDSIIDCGTSVEDISKVLDKACDPVFRKSLQGMTNPYGDGKAAARIKKILKETGIDTTKKRFFDINFTVNK